MLGGLPIVSVPVLSEGSFAGLEALTQLIGRSLYKSAGCVDRLMDACHAEGQDPERVLQETDGSDLVEGLYVKWEDEQQVLGRFKFIRPSFFAHVMNQGTHWIDRPILPNGLAEGVDLFGGAA